MAKSNKIMTNTPHKTIIRHGELDKVLTPNELKQWENILVKVLKYDMENAGKEDAE